MPKARIFQRKNAARPAQAEKSIADKHLERRKTSKGQQSLPRTDDETSNGKVRSALKIIFRQVLVFVGERRIHKKLTASNGILATT